MLLTIITPNKTVFNEEIDEITLNTGSGQIGIMPHHMPLVATVVPGEMIIKIKDKTHHFATTGGFLEVGRTDITMLADYAIHSDEIEVEKALAAKKRAENILKNSREGISERDYAIAQADLRRALSEIHVAQRRRKSTRSPLTQG